MPVAKYEPTLCLPNLSVLPAKDVPIEPFYYRVNEEMYSVGGS